MAEHDLVIKTLEPLEPGRRCSRLVGEVLVERTVGDVLPAVQKQRENLLGVRRHRGARRGECCAWLVSCSCSCCWCRRASLSASPLTPPPSRLLPPPPPRPPQLLSMYQRQLESKQKEVLDFQAKYNIRIKVGGRVGVLERRAPSGGEPASQPGGLGGGRVGYVRGQGGGQLRAGRRALAESCPDVPPAPQGSEGGSEGGAGARKAAGNGQGVLVGG